MLYKSNVEKVIVEHRDIHAVDDIVVNYTSPGICDGGTRFNADFYQVKYHVSQRGSVNHDSVLDPRWTGTKQPLLKRFSEAWKEIRSICPASRLNLVTNWAWDPKCPLAPLIQDGGQLDEKFFMAKPSTEIGRIRANWMTVSSLGGDDFKEFVQSLRFSTSAVSQSEAEEWLNDRCLLAGLVPIDLTRDWSPYDDLGERLIENGRVEHTPETLLKLVGEMGLIQAKVPLFNSTFAVRSFKRFAHVPVFDGACAVDLTDLFDNRLPIAEDSWSGEVTLRLKKALPELEKLNQPVRVALDVHLSIAWFIGHLLNSKSGISVILPQRIKGKGIEQWDVSKPYLPRGAGIWKSSLEKLGKGRDLALVISITHSAITDAKRHIGASLPSVGSILHFELSKLGAASIQDGGHARWLADELAHNIGRYVSAYLPSIIHVFPACPASIMFLLGQEAEALGPTTVYEFGFGDANRRYYVGMSIK